MSDSHEITVAAPVEVVQRQETELHPFVAATLERGNWDPSSLEKLMDLQERHDKREAEKAFVSAMTELRKELPSVIGHDTDVDYVSKRTGGRTKFSHTSLAKAVHEIIPYLSKYGLSHSWYPSNDGRSVTVTCRITHVGGHFQESSLTAPPDDSGNKNPAQAICSTQTLLQRYTLLGMLGIATYDMREPKSSSGDGVDTVKNLQAVSALKAEGVSQDDACHHVGKPVQQWTADDLQRLRDLVKKRRAQRRPAPKNETSIKDNAQKDNAQVDIADSSADDIIAETERTRVALMDAAMAKWGDDGILKLGQILRGMGTSIQSAGLDALNNAMDEMQ